MSTHNSQLVTHNGGVLVVDKPAGPTSHDIVEAARRALKTPRVGHVGTLDPFATGVLPLVVGKATRLSQFFSADRKEYVATLLLGTRTTTFDLEGGVIESRPVSVARPEVERALATMMGTSAQRPPAFSAKKIGGTPAHRLARAGTAVAPAAVTVTVFELELRAFASPDLVVRLVTSGGFYVRAFAEDLGQRLGTGACLKALRRARSGTFSIDDALTFEHLLKAPEEAAARIIPMARLLPELPAARLTPEGVRMVSTGRAVGPPEMVDGMPEADRVRLIGSEGALVAIAQRTSGGALHPSVVLI